MSDIEPQRLGATWRGFTDESLGPLSLAAATASAPFLILPIGSTEQHGSVLPVGMDWIVATELAVGVGRRLGAYVLPALPFGTAMEHRGSAGTVWLRPATLALVVRDVLDAAAAWGMKKAAIVSGHGGNFILGPTVRELNTDHPDRQVVLVPERIVDGPTVADDELHGGKYEMSMGCHLLDIGPPPEAYDAVPDSARDELNHRPLLDLSPTGVWGHPSWATTVLGAEELAEGVNRIVQYLSAMFMQDPPN